MRNNKEYFGTLRGFDDFINLVRESSVFVLSNNLLFTRTCCLFA